MLHLKISISAAKLPLQWGEREQAGVERSAANRVRALTKQHLEAKGGRSYWSDAANATEVKQVDGQLLVSVNHIGVRLHYYGTAGLPGGVLRATGRVSAATGKPTKRLLIPNEESPLRRAGVKLYELGLAEQDVSVHRKNGRAWLFGRMGGQEVLLGQLVESVHMDADPTTLPPDSALSDAAAEGALAKLKQLFR